MYKLALEHSLKLSLSSRFLMELLNLDFETMYLDFFYNYISFSS